MNVSQQRSDPSRQQQDRHGVEGGQGRRHLNGDLERRTGHSLRGGYGKQGQYSRRTQLLSKAHSRAKALCLRNSTAAARWSTAGGAGWGRVGKGRGWGVLWLKRRLGPNNAVPVCQAQASGLRLTDRWEPVTRSGASDARFRTTVLAAVERIQPGRGPQVGGSAREAQGLSLRAQFQMG